MPACAAISVAAEPTQLQPRSLRGGSSEQQGQRQGRQDHEAERGAPAPHLASAVPTEEEQRQAEHDPRIGQKGPILRVETTRRKATMEGAERGSSEQQGQRQGRQDQEAECRVPAPHLAAAVPAEQEQRQAEPHTPAGEKRHDRDPGREVGGLAHRQ